MCGFVTLLVPSGQRVRGAVLRRMTARLAHRGPDDLGFACIDPPSGALRTWGPALPDDLELSGVLFGHCRLSILDLSPAAHQPMVSDESSSVLCFNGAIYNFLELRCRLVAEGASFRGTGDTEVLLKAYDRWGVQALPRLNGMWAFVLWDGSRRTLVASRDRFGVKPLYHAVVDGVQIFGSEIKGVVGYPGAFRGFEGPKVHDFLRDGLTDHTDQTMFRGIRSLPPGTSIELGDGRCSAARYWSFPGSEPTGGAAPETLIAGFRELLSDAVGLRVRSDVPIGTMMSGGLDSTAIAALIREHQRDRGEAARTFDGLISFQHTFSACWPGSASDEEAEIDVMGAKLGLVCHKIYPRPETIADVLPSLAYHLDEPFFDPVAAVQYLLMREARAQGAKVVLNGHGSDESLAGYRLMGRLGGAGMLAGQPRGSAWDPADSCVEPPGLTALGAALWFQFAIRNVPRWLRMEDRVSMAASVESRLPFLDYRLVEFAFALPDDLKLRDGYSKYILRQAMRDLLPARLLGTRTKRPFLAPFAQWLRGPWRPMIKDLLSHPGQVAPYLNYPRFRANLDAIEPNLLWRVLSVELWMRAFAGGEI
ncbi:MAG: asparagine synthase (glutamine-hydrolyzing) [Gemmatimonadales bacterium]|nr:asparagine synthase (glutamine-hydrolyzing) [Gemmatimonadales bacterium]